MDIELRALVDALPGLVWTALPDGGAEYLGRRWLEYTGLSEAEALGAGWISALHPDDAPQLRSRWAEIMASGAEGEVEARLRRRDGAYRWFLCRASPMANAAGEVSRWYGLSIDIDDAKRAEADARDDRRRFEQIVDDMPAIVALFAPNGPIVFSNKRMLAYHGQTLEQLQQGEPGYTFHPEDRPVILARYRQGMETGEPFDCEVRLLRGDGAYRWHVVRGFPLRRASGGVDLWCGLFTDVDDERQAQAELRRAYEFLAEAQRLSKTGSFTWDARPEEQIWSEEAYRILGLEPGSIVTVPQARDLVHPDDRHLFDAMVQRGQANQEMDTTYRIVTPQGEVRHVRTLAHRLDDVTDRAVYLGAVQDVSETKIAEHALKASEAELRRANTELMTVHSHITAAQQLSRTGSFTWDIVADQHHWSEELYRIAEVDPGETIDMARVRACIHPDDQPSLEAAIERAMDGRPFEYAGRIVTPRGAIKHFVIAGHRIESIADRPVFVGALQDVTETKLAEDALNKARAELAHVARVTALSALTASIAHEVNQPLAGIITNASTCLRFLGADPPNIEGARATAQRTIRDGNRASDVIQRLRGLFARKPPGRKPLDLNDTVGEVVALTAGELQSHRVALRLEFADDLPLVRGDRVQLQQVVVNLLLNAADAMKGVDGRARAIVLRTSCEALGEVSLTVRDSGVGLDPEHHERLFDAFYTTKPDGMGVGLAISRSIIESHEGRLWAQPNGDGPGATFAFSLPVDTGAAGDLAAGAPTEPAEAERN
jgi:PAS domain S-box-containing protein